MALLAMLVFSKKREQVTCEARLLALQILISRVARIYCLTVIYSLLGLERARTKSGQHRSSQMDGRWGAQRWA